LSSPPKPSMTYEHDPAQAVLTATHEQCGALLAACVPELKRLKAQSSPGRTNERDETDRLRTEIGRLEREVVDHQIALLTSNEHGDLVEEHLYRLSTSLTAERLERQAADEKLQHFVQALSREKGDLQTLVQILIDQGDEAAEEGEKARIDGLTQIANRRRFDEYLATEWGRHLRAREPLSLLLCDVDHFKFYNDGYGHQAGDECLKAVAAIISHCCRAGALVARYGGEEFAIVLPHTGRGAALVVAERIRLALETAALPHSVSPVSSQVTLSIGIGCKIPQLHDANGARLLIEEADRHLYLAKHRGRNRAVDSFCQ
jgi:diguanylate cyclase (GGDEF)-like protein